MELIAKDDLKSENLYHSRDSSNVGSRFSRFLSSRSKKIK